MTPGLCMIIDPRPGEARAGVGRMLSALGAETAGAKQYGRNWSAGLIPPYGREASCGIFTCNDGRGTLLLVGDLFLPAHWHEPAAQQHLPIDVDTSRSRTASRIMHQLYTKGLEALADINGVFCGAWHDVACDRWHVFNDRAGFLPVFWAANGSRVVIGTRAHRVWQESGLPLQFSDEGVLDVIRAQNVTEDHTLIEGVHWLIGGHALVIDARGRTSTSKYWEFQHLPEAKESIDDLIDSYVEAAGLAVRRAATCDAPLRLGLSGGMDSRIILALCADMGKVPDCFTTGWNFSEDVRYGRGLARAAGAPHQWVPLSAQRLHERMMELVVGCDGLHSAAHLAFGSAIPDYLRSTPGGVLLEGMVYPVGGGGCVAEDQDAKSDPPHAARWAQANLHGGGRPESVNAMLHPEFAESSWHRWQAYIDDKHRRVSGSDPLRKAEYVTQSGRSGRNNALTANVWRPHVLLRHPLCDREMEQWFASAPPALRRGKRIYMEVLRRRFPAFARVQRTNYSGLPIAEDRLLRERCWYSEKAYRWWTSMRHPWTRRLGTDGAAVRAWGFLQWRDSGGLDPLRAADARVLRWVRREALDELWRTANRDPLRCVPLLTLATIELTLRHLETLPCYEAQVTVAPERSDCGSREREVLSC